MPHSSSRSWPMAALLCLLLTSPWAHAQEARPAATAAAALPYAQRGPHAVTTLLEVWTDAKRSARQVPVKIYLPQDLQGSAAVIIVSHGLGGSREGYRYLGEHLAGHGYLSVHLQHAGSDTAVVTAAAGKPESVLPAMRRAANDPTAAVQRPRDVSFAIDRLLELNDKPGPLQGRIDAARIGITGHSFGAFTVMAVAGQTLGRGLSFADPRIKAGIAMSPPGGRAQAGSYQTITIPLMMMTGTLDDSPVGGGNAADRLKIYPWLVHCPAYLLLFTGGDHMVYSGGRRAFSAQALPGTTGAASKDAAFQGFVQAATLAFFAAYLDGDGAARAWLDQPDGAQAALGELGRWEYRPPAAKAQPPTSSAAAAAKTEAR